MSLVLDYQKRSLGKEEFSCFVIMPFNNKRDTVYRRAIRPAVEKAGLKCIRADERLSPTPILFDIYDAILSARVVLADISEPNANVYYELGIGHALKQHVILLCEKDVKLPFDISGIRHISYEWGMGGDEALQSALEQFLQVVLAEPTQRLSESKHTLERAYRIWSKAPVDTPGEITISQEQFVEAVLEWDEIDVSEEEAAYLAHGAAYYGKLMRVVAERVATNRRAISALVIEVAAGTTIRVPWRASAMLEHMGLELVREECRAYTGMIRNNLFPNAFLNGKTQQMLSNAISGGNLDQRDVSKLRYALRQIEGEFGKVSTTHNQANAADAKSRAAD
ncbi:MAG: hypothetical protein U9N47_01695 [Thermodesulfobacteriota bacterium]|nr:hypothetical protein [Thermodesulfobacteriota bacterium]